MRKILFLLSLCLCLSSCTPILLALAILDAQPKMSFKANGESFTAEDSDIGTFRIIEVDGHGFAIAFSCSNWSSENLFEDAVISLNCGFFAGRLEKNEEYVFTTDDNLDAYPTFKHTVSEVVESTPESSVSSMTTVWLNATEGWFKITKLDKDDGTLSGKFSFTAVCDDPASDEVIEITEGFLKNIPYIVVKDTDSL